MKRAFPGSLVLILASFTLLLPATAFANSSARQDETPRYLDVGLVPAEGRSASDFVPKGWKLEGDEA